MAIIGDLGDLGVSDLLYIFKMRGATGRLILRQQSVTATLHFRQGRLISVTSSQVWRRLGDLLINSQKVSQDDVERALVMQAASENPLPLGVWLIRHGFVHTDDLKDVLNYQAEEILMRVMTWTQGTFSFSQQTDSSPTVPLPDINIDHIILEAMRQADELARFKAEALGFDYRLMLNDPNAAGVDSPLTFKEMAVIAAVAAGATRLRHVAQITQLPDQEFLHLIDGLVQRRLLSLTDPAGYVVSLVEEEAGGNRPSLLSATPEPASSEVELLSPSVPPGSSSR